MKFKVWDSWNQEEDEAVDIEATDAEDAAHHWMENLAQHESFENGDYHLEVRGDGVNGIVNVEVQNEPTFYCEFEPHEDAS